MNYTVKLPAFAKINLGLSVLGRRADGYHEIDTVFQTISLHDAVSIAATDDSGIVFSCDDRSMPSDDTNLVVRAANTLQQHTGLKRGARIRLEKRIPARAGLGGGSSDAAAALIGLAMVWKLDLEKLELQEIAAALGADVPFFLYGGTARGRGIGEQVEVLSDIAETFLLVVKPNANISTVAAYRVLDQRSLTSPNSKTILSRSDASKVFDSSDLAALRNDFEAVALALEPEIGRAKIALLKAGARSALLAGSGSAVFGIFDSEDAQRRAIQAIELETGWRVFPCKTVGRNDYRSALGRSFSPSGIE